MCKQTQMWRLPPLALCLLAAALLIPGLMAQDAPATDEDAPESPTLTEKAKDAARRTEELGRTLLEDGKEAAEKAAPYVDSAAAQARALSDSAAVTGRTLTDSAVATGKDLYAKYGPDGRNVGGVTIYEAKKRKWRKPEGDPTILQIRIEGPVDTRMLNTIRLGFRKVKEDRSVAAVVLDMHTPGGGLAETSEILGIIRDADVPTYVYVNSDAGSAGAIMSFGTRGIYMAPSAKIGSAVPIMQGGDGEWKAVDGDLKAKLGSWSNAEIRSLCEENGHIPEVGYAMMDPDVELKVGDRVLCKKGEVLAFTAREAVEVIPPLHRPILAAGILEDIDELPAAIDMPDATITTYQLTSAQNFANLLLIASPLLLTGFMIGIYIEMNTPGFGVAGGLSILCLGLFVLGQYMVGYAAAWEPVIIFVGLVLLAIEIFVVPGFGFFGIAGILSILVGAVLMMMPEIHTVDIGEFDSPFEGVRWGYLQMAFVRLGIGVGLGGIGVLMAARFLPQSALFSRIVLQSSARKEDGYVGVDVETRSGFIGMEGVALTDLRPAGTVKIGHDRLDVVSDGEFIYKGDAVRVTEVNGPRITVVRVAAPPATTDTTPEPS